MAVISTPWGEDGTQALRFRAEYLRCLPMLHFVYSAINPVPVKSLMQAVGLPAGPLRRPLTPLDPTALARGLEIARALELDRRYGYRLGAAAA